MNNATTLLPPLPSYILHVMSLRVHAYQWLVASALHSNHD